MGMFDDFVSNLSNPAVTVGSTLLKSAQEGRALVADKKRKEEEAAAEYELFLKNGVETNEKQIVRVLNNILERIDTLELQQARNKEFAVVVKKRLLDLNEFVNDVLDIVGGTSFEDDLILEQKLTEYTDLRRMVEKELEEQEFDIEFKNSIVGES